MPSTRKPFQWFTESHDIGKPGILAVREMDGTYALWVIGTSQFVSRGRTLEEMIRYECWPAPEPSDAKT